MKKGFTLIELLAVIIILSIILMIVIPTSIDIIEKSALKQYESNALQIEKSAEMCVVDGNCFLSNETVSVIYVSDLATKNYLKGSLYDKYNKKDMKTGYVIYNSVTSVYEFSYDLPS